MKKMERIDDELFRPITGPQQTMVAAGGTLTAVTADETTNPPDFIRDGDHE